MKAETKACGPQLSAMRAQLAQFQQDAFERGVNHGIGSAMIAAGISELRVNSSDIVKLAERTLTVEPVEDAQGRGWIFKFV